MSVPMSSETFIFDQGNDGLRVCGTCSCWHRQLIHDPKTGLTYCKPCCHFTWVHNSYLHGDGYSWHRFEEWFATLEPSSPPHSLVNNQEEDKT